MTDNHGKEIPLAIRDIFLPLFNYPQPTATGAIETAVDLAQNLAQPRQSNASFTPLKSRVSAIILEIEIEPGLYFEGAHIGEFLEAEAKKSAAHARDLVATFENIVSNRPLTTTWRIEKRTAYHARRLVVDEAKLHHITALPLRKGDVGDQEMAEQLIFESGRPVLVYPEWPVRPLSKRFDRVAVAWDGSRQAARAVADAMPFLRHASHVRIFSATDDKVIPNAARASDIAEQLRLEGVDAIYEDIKKTNNNNVGSFMECYVADHNCDLLVMGGFGHAWIREFILGGATNSILANPPGWVMLSH